MKRLILVTTHEQVYDVSDEEANRIVTWWERGLNFRVRDAFTDIDPYEVGFRLAITPLDEQEDDDGDSTPDPPV